MNPVYLDLHIHTSANADNLDHDYDLETLRQKLDSAASGSPILVSLTDHNTVNKDVYLRAVEVFDNLLLGAELHVRNYDEAPPYHSHIFFRLDAITETEIDAINGVLDVLYPTKMVLPPMRFRRSRT
jgi:hypothetical protein